METREILLKAEKGTLSWEPIDGGKIRFKTSSWDDAVVTTRSQVLEIAMVDILPSFFRLRCTRMRSALLLTRYSRDSASRVTP
jgi:hypothetical protein